MKILVTGATGFIGESLITKLIKEGHDVVATSRDEAKAKSKDWFNQVTFIPFTIGKNTNEHFTELFHAPDVLIHTAWDQLHDYRGLHHIETNLFHHYHFIKACVESGISNINVLGTCFEYGPIEGKLSESLLVHPTNNYGIAKNALRIFLEALQKEHPFHLKWIRLFYNYGKASNSNSIYAQLMRAIEQNEPFFNMSPGDQKRDYMHFDELIEKIEKISKQQRVTGIINCCSGSPIRVIDLMHKLIEENKSSIQLNPGFYPYSTIEPMHFWGDNQKLNAL